MSRKLGLEEVIGHPLRQLVLYKYAEAVTSPSKVAAALGEPVNLVSYHTKVLERARCIELVRTEPRRGAREHFYRGLTGSEIEDDAWLGMPLEARRAIARGALAIMRRETAAALPAGGMDDGTTHLSRSFYELDEEGRAELARLLRSTLDHAAAIERASRERQGPNVRSSELLILHFEAASRP